MPAPRGHGQPPMREIASGVFLENKYPGPRLAAVTGARSLLLIDAPLRTEDGREWLAALAGRGRPRALALLDHHPDRALGARGFDLPMVAHEHTRQAIAAWPDAFKGAAAPIGAEADRIKRITGVRKAVPEITFTEGLEIHLGDRPVQLLHRPGPTAGAIWVLVPDCEVIFVGDAVTAAEPPYLGEADLEAWMETLEELRRLTQRGHVPISSRDGRIGSDEITAMIRFLRKIPGRLEKLAGKDQAQEAAASAAAALLEGFRVPAARREQAQLRLQAGLLRLGGHQPAAGA